jgi:MFS family permease
MEKSHLKHRADVCDLDSAISQPLFGQLSDIWGRRWVFLATVAIFTFGSGLCGGASSGDMLIAARGVQGIGGGGINMVIDLLICDLVPMRERAKYMGVLFAIITVFTSIGPLVGGALAQAGAWRWAFYMNLPIGGPILVVMWVVLRVGKPAERGFRQKIWLVDFWGIGLLTASTVATLYALTYGGSARPWSDSSVLTPLVAGLLALVMFVLFEGTAVPKQPVTPYRLFGNRTSAAAFYVSFQHSLISTWVLYMYPLYFQAVLRATPTMSGLYLFPFVFSFPMAAAVSGALVAKHGRYRPVHHLGFALVTLGCGLSALLDPSSSAALWVFLLIFIGLGLGMIMTCLLPAVQAKLPEADTALSTGSWAFIRSVGIIWGVSIPAAIFNNQIDQNLPFIDDEDARQALNRGKAYSRASKDFINSFSGETRAQVLSVYSKSLRYVWLISIVFAGSAFLAVFLEREVKLRTELKTEFGLEKEKTEKKTEVESAPQRPTTP